MLQTMLIDVLNDMGEDFDYQYDWVNSECNIPEIYYKARTLSSNSLGGHGFNEMKQDERILLRQRLFQLKCCSKSPVKKSD